MRRKALSLLVLALAVVAGCTRTPEAPTSSQLSSSSMRASSNPEPGAVQDTASAGGTTAASTAATGAFDPAELATDGYKCTFSQSADLDRDGVKEYILGYQFEAAADLGEPKEVAYVTLAKKRGSQWSEWFSIPGPAGEKYCDKNSLVAAADLNKDGVVELVLRFYDFGVSSRPENLYVWQVKKEGLESVADQEPIELSSDDALGAEDTDLAYPGKELLVVVAQMGGEVHSAPHKYKVFTYGWTKGKYWKVASFTFNIKFTSAEKALYAYTHGTDY